MLSNLRTHTHTRFSTVSPSLKCVQMYQDSSCLTARCLTPFGSTITATWILVHPAIQLEPAAEPTGTQSVRRALVW